jgi:hypothetical protein
VCAADRSFSAGRRHVLTGCLVYLALLAQSGEMGSRTLPPPGAAALANAEEAVQAAILPLGPRRTVEPQRRPFSREGLYFSLAAAQALDHLSTSYALQHGGNEALPLMGRSDTRLAISAATVALASESIRQISKRQPRTARALTVGFVLVKAYFAAHNWRLIGF